MKHKTFFKSKELRLSFIFLLLLSFIPLTIMAQDKKSKIRISIEKDMKKKIKGKKTVYHDNGISYIMMHSFYHVGFGDLSPKMIEHRNYLENIEKNTMKNFSDIIYLGFARITQFEEMRRPTGYLQRDRRRGRLEDIEPIFLDDYGNGRGVYYKYFFIPKSQKLEFAGYQQTKDFADMEKTGKGYIFNNNNFAFINNVNWSGEIKNGFLEGIGEGYCYYNQAITFFKGQFHNGRPEGVCHFYNINHGKNFKSIGKSSKIEIDWDDSNYASLDIDGKKESFIDPGMNVHNIRDILVNVQQFNEVLRPLKFVGMSAGNVVARGAYKNRKWDGGVRKWIAYDSVNVEIIINKEKKIIGFSEKGKNMVNEHLNKFASSIDLLTKVYNITDISDPVNNLRKKHNIDLQTYIVKFETIENFINMFPEAKSMLQNNKELSTRISLIQNLLKLYNFLSTDDVAEARKKAESFDARDAAMRPLPSQGETWTIHNWVSSPTRVKDNSMSNEANIDKLVNDPLFPIKNQDVVNKIKAVVKSKIADYNKKYPQIYDIAASRLRYAKEEIDRKSMKDYTTQNSLKIDKNRSTSPSGNLVRHGGLISSEYYEYEKHGSIRNTNGYDLIYYNMLYDSQKKFLYYRVDLGCQQSTRHLNGKTFKTYNEMIQAIINAN